MPWLNGSVPVRGPERGLHAIPADLPLRLVRHPHPGATLFAGTDLCPPRVGFRAREHALAGNSAALLPVRPEGRPRELARRANLGGTAHTVGDEGRMEAV